MEYLYIIQQALIWIVTIYWLYQFIISLCSFVKIKEKPLKEDKQHSFVESTYYRSIKTVSERTGIPLEPAKRRKKEKRIGRARHVAAITAMRDAIYPDGSWRQGNGRKPKKQIVVDWRAEHPEGKKADCIRDTGLTKPTVYKWWKAIDEEKEGE